MAYIRSLFKQFSWKTENEMKVLLVVDEINGGFIN